MKALLYKDFVALWKYCKSNILMCVCFLIAYVFMENMDFFRLYPMIFMGMLPSTLIAYDERDKWENLALTMPVSRWKIVSSKYIMGLILQCAAMALVALAMVFQGLRLGHMDWAGFGDELIMSWTLAIGAPSLMLPPVFKMGAEKGRLAYTLMLFLVLTGGLGGIVLLSLIEGTLGTGSLYLVLITAFVLLMYPVSWALSVHWYNKREF